MKCSFSYASKIEVNEQKREEAGVSLHNCRVKNVPTLLDGREDLDGVEGEEKSGSCKVPAIVDDGQTERRV